MTKRMWWLTPDDGTRFKKAVAVILVASFLLQTAGAAQVTVVRRFPANRGPWPQKQRPSAVRYTDWAIGDFLARARKHAWFDNTVFVFTADHCAMSAGKAALPAFRYRIPLWVYAPGHVAPGTFDGIGVPVTREHFLTHVAAGVDSAATLTWVPQEFLAEQK